MHNMNFKNVQFRLEQKTDKHTDEHAVCHCGCWIWAAGMDADRRYGKLWVTGRTVGAHRASYMAFNHRIDLPLDVSHVCHRKKCVNPGHLSHEEHNVNIEREACKRNGQCTDNHRSPDGKVAYKICTFIKCEKVGF